MLPLFLLTDDKVPFSSVLTDDSEADEFFTTVSTCKDLSFPSDDSSDPQLLTLPGFSAHK